jgi:aminoglycoside phosphotransferase (APT) family kinase protein
VSQRRLIAEGREAEVFDVGDGRVLKLFRSYASAERLAFEVAALKAARAAGVRTPEVHAQVVEDGRPGIVMERVNGIDLLSAIGRQPWLVVRFGCLTGRIHAHVNTIPAPTSVPPVRDRILRALARVAAREPSLRVDWIERILDRLPDGDALCHGDFHPGQLIFASGETAVFDWAGASRGDALFDYARTRLVLRMGELPPGTPPHLKLLATVGRRLLVSGYTRCYERSFTKRIDRARLRDWETVNLAVRLSENIPGERAYLHQRLKTLEAQNAQTA